MDVEIYLVFSIFVNHSLPDWVKAIIGPGGEFERAAYRYFQMYTETPELTRLSYGFYIRDVFERCTEVINGTLSPNRSLWYPFSFVDNNQFIKII